MKQLSLVLLALLLAVPVSADEPIELIGKTRAEFYWTPASGPVWGYAVFIKRNSEWPDSKEQLVRDNEVTVEAEYGDMIAVQVAAWDEHGNQGPLSEESESVIFLPPIGDEPPEDDPEPIPVPTPDLPTFPLPEASLVVFIIDHGNPKKECAARGLLLEKTISRKDGRLRSRCTNRKGE